MQVRSRIPAQIILRAHSLATHLWLHFSPPEVVLADFRLEIGALDQILTEMPIILQYEGLATEGQVAPRKQIKIASTATWNIEKELQLNSNIRFRTAQSCSTCMVRLIILEMIVTDPVTILMMRQLISLSSTQKRIHMAMIDMRQPQQTQTFSPHQF